MAKIGDMGRGKDSRPDSVNEREAILSLASRKGKIAAVNFCVGCTAWEVVPPKNFGQKPQNCQCANVNSYFTKLT